MSLRTDPGAASRFAVRRAPSFVVSDEPTLKLLADFLKVVTAEWDEVSSGRWRLGLIVADRARSVEDVEALCEIARAVGDAAAFGEEVGTPGRTTGSVRDRLPHVTATIAKASESLGLTGITPDELTWRVLSNLQIARVHLEGLDESTRTDAIARLREVTLDRALDTADGLFGRLVELAQRYGPTGSRVTIAELRRDLAGFPLARVPSSRPQWEILERYGERAHDRTGFSLQHATTSLELPRSELLAHLSATIGEGRTNVALVVQGEPDVGKSSLVLREAHRLREEGVDVLTLSLRDVPARIAEFEAVLAGDLDAVFASAATDVGHLLVVDGAEAVLEGHDIALLDLATSALRQGFTVVAVSRADGGKAVIDALRDASGAAGISEPQTFEVPPLLDAEMEEVGRAFPSVSGNDGATIG